jgi:hypothetical protein
VSLARREKGDTKAGVAGEDENDGKEEVFTISTGTSDAFAGGDKPKRVTRAAAAKAEDKVRALLSLVVSLT